MSKLYTIFQNMTSLSVSMSMLVLYLGYFNILNTAHSLFQISNIDSICLPENHIALFIFGDSFFDVGNNNYINATTFFQANFPPYGETFFKYPSGRFSNGRVIPDFIAEYAKLPLIVPYLHPRYHDQYIYGVNFASAGAGALVETNEGDINTEIGNRKICLVCRDGDNNFVSQVINLKTQALFLAQVSKQLRQKLGEEEANKLVSRAVYIFSIGGNDYGTPFFANPTGPVVLPYSQQQFVDFVIGNITSVIKDIYSKGGRKFGFLNLAPTGCFPILRRFVNGTKIADCLKSEATALARLHNNALPKMLQKIEKQLIGFRYSIFDTYSALLQAMECPSIFGFKEGNAACCGGGPYRGDYSCGGKRGIEEYELCDNVSEYVFFDSLHPTDRAAEHFAKLMWSGNGDVIQSSNLEQLFCV